MTMSGPATTTGEVTDAFRRSLVEPADMFTSHPIARPGRPRQGFRRLTAAVLLATAAIAAAGCGGGPSGGHAPSGSAAEVAEGQPYAFAWLRPSPPPRAWRASWLPNGAARMAFPPDWRSIRSDPGTVSAALRSRSGEILGYLNATPRQGSETLDNWGSFRVDHNGDEGDVDLTPVAAATDLSFRRGVGACVIDDYTSSSGHRYREIACIVAGARATTVIVGAVPPGQWRKQGPTIERSISSFVT